MSKLYTFRAVQQFPTDINTLWKFASSPKNLRLITPAYMGFDIVSDFLEEEMYPGQIIAYKVSPLLGIPMTWITEITHVKDQAYFVDNQRFGPYAMWHHRHVFRSIQGGVEMTDLVHYKLPMGWLGDWAHALLVRRKIEDIFHYRYRKMEALFGKISG